MRLAVPPRPMTNEACATTALVLLAHGARDPEWTRPLLRLHEALAASAPTTPVEIAFLELMTPDLGTAVRGLVGRGATEVVVIPVFLGQGAHVRRDIPARIAALADEHPGLALRCAGAVGDDADVIAALARYCMAQLRSS